jgi:outer membrane protein assembly factor BamB
MRPFPVVVVVACQALCLAAADTAPAADDVANMAGVPGGLCVYLDCGDGRAMAEIARGGRFLVHGLTSDAASVSAVRQALAGQGVAELTTVEALAPAALPYEKNHVNLVVADNLQDLLGRGLTIAEIVRVLAPYGGACLGAAAEDEAMIKPLLAQCGIRDYRFAAGSRSWLVFRKPRPPEMGDWTHYFHAADANLVANDTYFGGPNQLQWITGPALGPANTHFSDLGPLAPASYAPEGKHNDPAFMLSANGRVFCYYGNNKIVARDAFSGALLWIKTGLLRVPVSAQAQVAAGDNLFAISADGEVVALSGATGERIRSFDKAGPYASIKYEDGLLFLFGERHISAFDAVTAEKRWAIPLAGENAFLRPGGQEKNLRLKSAGSGNKLVSEGRIYLRNSAGEMVGIDARDGKVLFRRELLKTLGADWWMFRLAAGGKVFVHTITPSPNPKTFSGDAGIVGGGKYTATSAMANFHAISGKDGSVLWTRGVEMPWMRYGYAGYVYKASGLFWFTRWTDDVWDLVRDGVGSKKGHPALDCRPEPPVWMGIDPDTGEVKETYTAPPGRMDKCQREVVTERFLMPGELPYYFIDWKTKTIVKRSDSIWLNCEQVGPVIAQGLLYAFNAKTGCGCGRYQTYGFQAWSCDDRTTTGEPVKEEHPLEAGAAEPPAPTPAADPGDWPTYRHDMQRTAATAAALPGATELATRWRTATLAPASETLAGSRFAADHQLNAPSRDAITGPTVAGGKVFVALTHARQVKALNAADGKVTWTFHAPARLDTPPTIYRGVCLLGCNDGWAYALRADNGELIWRTRVAPAERRMIAYGQVESPWPVVGGVLVAGDTAYAIAGRTTEADGGLYVYAMNPLTGAAVWPKPVRYYQNDPGDLRTLPGTKTNSWRQWNVVNDPRRSIKTEYVGTADLLGSDGVTLQIGCRGYGNIDCKTGAPTQKNCNTAVFGRLINLPYTSQASTAPYFPAAFTLGKPSYRRASAYDKASAGYKHFIQGSGWKLETTPGLAQAVCLAGDTLLAAITDNAPGNPKGELWAISTDGKKRAAYPLPAAPAYDGIAVANGKVYVSLTDGSVACLAKK